MARVTTEMYTSSMQPAMKPSDAFDMMAHREIDRVEIDHLEGRATAVLMIVLGGAQVVAWLLALLPFLRLMYLGATSQFGANPLEFVTRSTGTWTLVMLCVTLAVTPLRRLTGWNWLLRLRRMLGLFAFFYAVQHFLLWLVVDRGFDVAYMIKDIGKRGDQAFVDLENALIETLFKLYPWEWMLREQFGLSLPLAPTRWFEPPWKMLLSCKAILPASPPSWR